MAHTLREALGSPYRVVRRLAQGADAPWPADLVTIASGESRLLVAADRFPAEWAGWTADPAGHILGPLDVARTEAGHNVVLPVLTERADDYLAQRAVSRQPLIDGERVTFGVSVVRGLAELRSRTPAVTGSWWLAEGGRPVFVAESQGDPVDDASAAVLVTIDDGAGGACAEAADVALAPRPSHREWARLEQRLFEIAEPCPLADSASASSGPARFDALVADAARHSGAPGASRTRGVGEDVNRESLAARWGRHLDADLADLTSRALTSVWSRLRRRREFSRRSRVGLWAVAAIAACVVFAVGMLWPQEQQPDPPSPVSTAPTATASATPRPPDEAVDATSRPSAAVGAAERTPEAIVTAASELLEIVSSCGADAECLAPVMLHGSGEFPAGAAHLDATEREVTFVDEFGAVAVVRVEPIEPEDAMAQLMVLQRHDEQWRVRDVYAAHPPSS